MPLPETTYVSFEDDGITQDYKVGKYANIKLTLKTTKDIIKIKLEKSGDKNFIQDNYKIEVIDIKNRKVEIEQ